MTLFGSGTDVEMVMERGKKKNPTISTCQFSGFLAKIDTIAWKHKDVEII